VLASGITSQAEWRAPSEGVKTADFLGNGVKLELKTLGADSGETGHLFR
jgi:hypothetical protein